MAPSVIWEELTASKPPPTPAGKATRPPRRLTDPLWTDPGAQRYQHRLVQAQAGAQMILFALRSAAYVTMNTAINAALRAQEPQARRALQGHGSGGILATAHILVRFAPTAAFGVRGQPPIRNFGPEARRLVGLSLSSEVYARPEHALAVWASQRRRYGVIETAPDPDCEYEERRFFWGHWHSG